MNAPAPRSRTHRIVALALELAAHPPLRRAGRSYEARVPWRLIEELRDALDDAEIEWRDIHETIRSDQRDA
jgi:hypothetical protein